MCCASAPMRKACWLSLVLLVSACRSGDPPDESARPTRDQTKPVAPRAQAQATVQATARPQAQPPAQPPQAAQAAAQPGKAKRGTPIEFEGPIKWQSWQEGVAQAKASNKGIMLLVYADWCPHCRELKPVFANPEVAKLADGLVMIKQDADDEPGFLQAFAAQGSYVPRIFFLKPDGTMRPEITSGNGRFPYFYTPEGIEALKASMKRAAGG